MVKIYKFYKNLYKKILKKDYALWQTSYKYNRLDKILSLLLLKQALVFKRLLCLQIEQIPKDTKEIQSIYNNNLLFSFFNLGFNLTVSSWK